MFLEVSIQSKLTRVGNMDNQKHFFEFQQLCKSLVPESKKELLDKLCAKQEKLYKEANPDFVASDEFETILRHHMEILNGEKGEKEVFKSFWDLNQVLKGVKKTKVETLQNGTGDTKDAENEKYNNINGTLEMPSTSGSSDSGQNVAMSSEASGSSKDDKNQRRIEKLEKKLGKLHRAIQKLSEKELSLDEMEDESSIHIQEHRLRNRFVKGWEMLCKLKKISSATGRAKESALVYRGSNYKEINVKVTKLMNKPDHFPDYQEVLNLIEKVNEKKELGIDAVEVGVIAREVFVDIGNQLKGRRQQDLLQSFGYANLAMADDDPAEASEELRMKLKENEQLSSKKLSDELDKFSQEQRMREARGEDLEAASEDEEEDVENDDMDKDDDKFDKLNDEDDSDEEESPSSADEPATKKLKRESPCEDGIHCGTDSELSDNQESHPNTAKIVPSIRLKRCEMETETSDIDFFLAKDETATILTSGDEGSVQGDEKIEQENESDLSSVKSVVSLSDDDSDDERNSSLDSNAEELSSKNRTEDYYIPIPSEVSAQRSNGYHRDVDSSTTVQQGSCSKSTPQTDHYEKPMFHHSNGTAASTTAKNWDADSAYLSNDQLIDSDPIDELGEEGLVPVAECHSYAFVGRSQGGIQSVGTAVSKQPEVDADVDYIEIIDSSGSSPSPSVPETEREGSKQDQDVIVISDSD